MYLYGSGFPKSLDVSKAIDKAAGATREVVGRYLVPVDSDAGNAGKVIRSVTAESMFGVSAGREGTNITAPAMLKAMGA
jgi:site-specific DNA-methyltransferase (adenine-specific)